MRSRLQSLGVRILEYGLTFLAAAAINFTLPYAAPGDPLLYLVGPEVTELTPEERQELLAIYGLDQPIYVQFLEYLVGIFQGDLGTSIMYGLPVAEVLWMRLPWTLLLIGTSLVLSTGLGTLFGAVSAWREGRNVDFGLMTGIVVAMSAPSFWVGMLLIAVFGTWLGLLPTFGIRSVDVGTGVFTSAGDLIVHLVLPVVTLALAHMGAIYLIARNSVLATLEEDFLLFEKAKGHSGREVLFRHALPNSLLPVYTHFTLMVGALVGGSVVVETVFTYPGLGLLIYDAALARDYPLLQGAFLVLTVTVIGANLFADLTYPFIDPRTKASETETSVE